MILSFLDLLLQLSCLQASLLLQIELLANSYVSLSQQICNNPFFGSTVSLVTAAYVRSL